MSFSVLSVLDFLKLICHFCLLSIESANKNVLACLITQLTLSFRWTQIKTWNNLAGYNLLYTLFLSGCFQALWCKHVLQLSCNVHILVNTTKLWVIAFLCFLKRILCYNTFLETQNKIKKIQNQSDWTKNNDWNWKEFCFKY